MAIHHGCHWLAWRYPRARAGSRAPTKPGCFNVYLRNFLYKHIHVLQQHTIISDTSQSAIVLYNTRLLAVVTVRTAFSFPRYLRESRLTRSAYNSSTKRLHHITYLAGKAERCSCSEVRDRVFRAMRPKSLQRTACNRRCFSGNNHTANISKHMQVIFTK
jgi:hypothetical protein